MSCLRPDGAKPELEPIKDREDFEARMKYAMGRKRLLSGLRMRAGKERVEKELPYADTEIRRWDTEADQLVLMRAAQILDEAEQRRRSVLAGLRLNEVVLDADERRGD
jgi:hypothetical protein